MANSGVSSDSNYGGISSAVIAAARHLSPRRHPQAAGMRPEAEGGGAHWSEGRLLPPCIHSPHLFESSLPTQACSECQSVGYQPPCHPGRALKARVMCHMRTPSDKQSGKDTASQGSSLASATSLTHDPAQVIVFWLAVSSTAEWGKWCLPREDGKKDMCKVSSAVPGTCVITCSLSKRLVHAHDVAMGEDAKIS